MTLVAHVFRFPVRHSRDARPAGKYSLRLALWFAIAMIVASCVPRDEHQVHLRAAFWSPPGVEEQIARRFEAAHPGVKVDLLITGGRYAEKLQS
ncbi:MAG: hypothetical protein JWM35_582, partial [Verrucomicrobia bacterium]|nr:hypothetical protein [Verrucomicrobiota bacterium]